MQKFLLDRWTPQILSLLRIVVGFLFLWHGSQKLFDGCIVGLGRCKQRRQDVERRLAARDVLRRRVAGACGHDAERRVRVRGLVVSQLRAETVLSLFGELRWRCAPSARHRKP